MTGRRSRIRTEVMVMISRRLIKRKKTYKETRLLANIETLRPTPTHTHTHTHKHTQTTNTHKHTQTHTHTHTHLLLDQSADKPRGTGP